MKNSRTLIFIYRRKKIGIVTQQFVMIAFTFLALFPIYFMIATSFKDIKQYRSNMFGIPLHPTLVNYASAFRGGEEFIIWIINSLILTISSVTICIIVSSFAGYAFATWRFRGKRQLFNLTISLMVIPAIIMIIPLFEFFVHIGMINTRFSAILIYIGLMLPLCIYMLTSFFVTIHKDILDAAKIDGCSHLRILFSIILPLSKPALITLAIINSRWVWNELLIAMIFLQSSNLRPLMAGLLLYRGKFQVNMPVIMAGLLIASIPMIIVYMFGMRYFIRGLEAGAIKG